MKVAVIGLWHLGCVTAACLASAKHTVLAYDTDKNTIATLQQGHAPIFEPGLDMLLASEKQAGTLSCSNNLTDIADSEIIWVCIDTPVDELDMADVGFVEREIEAIFPYIKSNVIVLISSQIPVGTTRKLQQSCTRQWPKKNITFAYSPENLRLGKAIQLFNQPDRIIVGLQSEADKDRIKNLLHPFTQNIIWMTIESAEMTKHAINAFLASSVIFINELATLCERVGANAREVERGLKTEERIGPKAYLRPGAAIAGGTLARDVNFLNQLADEHQIISPLFSALLESNSAHRQWSCHRILSVLENLKDKVVVILGLAYTVGTDTLRRSAAIETCKWLSEQGAKVIAYDPMIKELPSHLSPFIELKSTVDHALNGADAIVITTEWPEFISITAEQLLTNVKQAIVFDASGFLIQQLGSDSRIQYFSVGK